MVRARSENAGPKVPARRENARVDGLNVNVNPPDEDPKGAVATSRAIARASVSPAASLPAMNVPVRSWLSGDPAAAHSRTVPIQRKRLAVAAALGARDAG